MILSSAAILLVRSVLNAALCLIVCLLAIAGLFILLSAEFLAIVQILVYAGGILLLIIFGIMITRHQEIVMVRRNLTALVLVSVITGMLWAGLRDLNVEDTSDQVLPASRIGISLVTDYALPFEVAGLLLLISMIGAMITSTIRPRA